MGSSVAGWASNNKYALIGAARAGAPDALALMQRRTCG